MWKDAAYFCCRGVQIINPGVDSYPGNITHHNLFTRFSFATPQMMPLCAKETAVFIASIVRVFSYFII